MKYLLLSYDDEAQSQLSAEENAAVERHVISWVQEMTDRGIRIFGSRLRPDDDTITLRVETDDLMISDGPFAETKEHLAGFEVLECASRKEALDVASRHPGARAGTVELRPLIWD